MKMNRLKELLDEKGLTQAYIAWKLGCSAGNVSKWCAGTRVPELKTALKIAKILNTSVEYIWGDAQEETHKDSRSYTVFTREQAQRIHDIIFREGRIEN